MKFFFQRFVCTEESPIFSLVGNQKYNNNNIIMKKAARMKEEAVKYIVPALK